MKQLSLLYIKRKYMDENKARQIVEKTRDDYNLIAREWDLSRNRASQLKINLVKNIKPKSKILDIGCGNALILPFISEKDISYFGLDISKNLIEIAEKKYAEEMEKKKVKFFVGQATDLPFQNEKFDFVISLATLHHLPSEKLHKKFFEEIKRVSKTGAKVKITVWNLYSDWVNDRFKIKDQLAGNKSGDIIAPWKATQGKVINRYLRQFSQKELFSLAKSAGFKDMKIDFWNRAGERTKNGEELVLEMKKK